MSLSKGREESLGFSLFYFLSGSIKKAREERMKRFVLGFGFKKEKKKRGNCHCWATRRNPFACSILS